LVKTEIILPFKRETVSTVVYAAKDVTKEVVGQVYVRKEYLEGFLGVWPRQVKITLEIE
jgi:hypothetical protein